jgi:hypothetical protein
MKSRPAPIVKSAIDVRNAIVKAAINAGNVIVKAAINVRNAPNTGHPTYVTGGV